MCPDPIHRENDSLGALRRSDDAVLRQWLRGSICHARSVVGMDIRMIW